MLERHYDGVRGLLPERARADHVHPRPRRDLRDRGTANCLHPATYMRTKIVLAGGISPSSSLEQASSQHCASWPTPNSRALPAATSAVEADTPGPAEDAGVEVEQLSRVAAGDEDCEEGDHAHEGERDPEGNERPRLARASTPSRVRHLGRGDMALSPCFAKPATSRGRWWGATRYKVAAETAASTASVDVASISLRYWCTNAIAKLPSPTAEATRLTGPERTSPQAKMPGMLVSRR
jgi:hypothetical protein